SPDAQISVRFSSYDSLCGIRGELHVQVKIQFFGDINPFNESSAGVSFYSTDSLPLSLNTYVFMGMVSATETDSDPEYHWADNFRTPRTSNHQRSLLLYKLSANLRRILGKKVLELGGNACIAYKQHFDLEIETKSITARAIGTAVRLTPHTNPPLTPSASSVPFGSLPSAITTSLAHTIGDHNSIRVETPLSMIHRALLESPKLIPEPQNETSNATVDHNPLLLPLLDNFLQPMLLTTRNLPPYLVRAMGGLVSATSVKLLEERDDDAREGWLNELRDELKGHAKALGCSAVIGYEELVAIAGDIVVLQCMGTAVVLNTPEAKRRGSKESGFKAGFVGL
ncbi:hypothetical protein HK096_010970, partial [Nowakowskiella sp. JEL0078]